MSSKRKLAGAVLVASALGRRHRDGRLLDTARSDRLHQRGERAAESRRLRAAERALAGTGGDDRRPGLGQARRRHGGQPVLRLPRQRADGARARLERRGAEDGARQERLPRLPERPHRRRPELQLRHPLPVPGPRGRLAGDRSRGSTSTPTRRTASRCWPRRTRAGDEPRRRSTASRWDPWSQTLLLHDREPERADVLGDARLPVDRHGRLRLARTRRLRGHPERLRRQRLDRRGHRRLGARRHEREAAEQLRLPLRPGHSDRPLERQAPGAPGARRRRAPDHHDVAGRGRRGRPRRPQHVRHELRHALGDDPQHGHRRHRAVQRQHARRRPPTARPFKRPENGVFRPDGKFKEFYFDEHGRHERDEHRERRSGGWGGLFKLSQKTPSADTGTLSIFYKGDQVHTGLRQHRVLLEGPGGGGRGRRRDAAHAAQRPRLGLDVRRHEGLLEPGEPAGALHRRGPRPVGDDRRRASSAPPASRTRTTTRSPASTSPTATSAWAACSARRRRSCSRTTASGAPSGRSSTATTSRGSCSGRPSPSPTTLSPPRAPRPGPQSRPGLAVSPWTPSGPRTTRPGYVVHRCG